MTKKVLVTEEIAQAGIDLLRGKGFEVDVEPGIDGEELVQAAPAYDAFIVGADTHVTRSVIDAAQQLRIIGRAGVGVGGIDVDAATEAGVVVCNAPTSNIVSAAELAIGFMVSCARNTPQANAALHRGEWGRERFLGFELYEKTLAIIGLGRTGALVADRARAFGMRLVAYDPYCGAARAEQLRATLCDKLSDALAVADFVTVHVPKTPKTVGLFGGSEFAQMKDGAVFVNMSHGQVADDEALAAALASGKLRAAAVDAFEEGASEASPLRNIENAILTPHLLSYTVEARERAGRQIADYVACGLEGKVVPTSVNMEPIPPAVMRVVGPYAPACQLMGSMLAQISGTAPSRLALTVAGPAASLDSTLLVAGALQGVLSQVSGETVTAVNAEAAARRHGIKVSVAPSSDAGGYASLATLELDGLRAACTLSGSSNAVRLVSLLGYKMDIAPGPQALIIEYVDRPGRVGTIGTILGRAGINITNMQIVDKPEEGRAIVYLNVEGDISDAVLDELRGALDQLKNLWRVSL